MTFEVFPVVSRSLASRVARSRGGRSRHPPLIHSTLMRDRRWPLKAFLMHMAKGGSENDSRRGMHA